VKTLTLLLLVLTVFGIACSRSQFKALKNQSPTNPGSEDSPVAIQAATDHAAEVPASLAEFAGVDFRNNTYATSLRGDIKLKNGTHEYTYPDGSGGDIFDLENVYFADLTNDGQDEAVVHLRAVSCGGSCDGGSDLFYFYSAANNEAKLLSRIETGSAAYECGLKSFVLTKQQLVLELFRTCRARGETFESLNDPKFSSGNKFEAHSFTRFVFSFNGKTFVVKKREVLPFPARNNLNYPATVTVSND
jgi:hypothetical protein